MTATDLLKLTLDDLSRAGQYAVWLKKKGLHDCFTIANRVLYNLGYKICPSCEGEGEYLMSATAHESEGWVPCEHCYRTGLVKHEGEIDGSYNRTN
jgi:hypothetical protein